MGSGGGGRVFEKAEEMRAAGRVDGDDVGEAAGQLWVVLEGGPGAQREAADAALQRPRAVRRVGDDGEHRLARAHEVADQAGDAGSADVVGRSGGLARELDRGQVAVEL